MHLVNQVDTDSVPVGRPCLCMPAGGCHGAHLPTLWSHSLAFRAAGQAILSLPTGTRNGSSQGARQTRATVAWGRALVVPAGQPLATRQVTCGAVTITAASTALMAPTVLKIAALLFAPARRRYAVCRQVLATLIGSTTVTDLKGYVQTACLYCTGSLCWSGDHSHITLCKQLQTAALH